MLRIVGAAVYEPVGTGDSVGGYAFVIDVAGLWRSEIGRRRREMQGNCSSNCENDQSKTQNSPCLHDPPLSTKLLRAPCWSEGMLGCRDWGDVPRSHVRCAAERKSTRCRTMEQPTA